MPEFIDDMRGNGLLKENANANNFRTELEKLLCENVDITTHENKVHFFTFGEVGYSWTCWFEEILRKYFASALVDVKLEDSQIRFELENGKVREIPAETISYYKGYEDEFISQLPREVINKIRRTSK